VTASHHKLLKLLIEEVRFDKHNSATVDRLDADAIAAALAEIDRLTALVKACGNTECVPLAELEATEVQRYAAIKEIDRLTKVEAAWKKTCLCYAHGRATTQTPEQCASVGPAPESFRCGLPAGHSGHHTALIETGAPWSTP